MTTTYTQNKQAESVISYLKENITEKRYKHIISVSDECMLYAPLFNLTEKQTEDLYTAALLHDITKEMPDKAQLEILIRNNISISEDDLNSPQILHATTGALFAKEKYNISDEIFGMIDAHTTGKKDMTIPEKLLFLCDFIEPTRTNEACRTLREKFREYLKIMPPQNALDTAVLESMDSTIDYLSKKNKPIS